jgi:hypothetical protein
VILTATILCCVIALMAPARTDDVSGAINGYIFDDSGHPIEQVTISAYTTEMLRGPLRNPVPLARMNTGRSGFFTFLGLVSGRYVLIASKDGYETVCSRPTTVVPNSLERINLRLWTYVTMLRQDNCYPALWVDRDLGIIF